MLREHIERVVLAMNRYFGPDVDVEFDRGAEQSRAAAVVIWSITTSGIAKYSPLSVKGRSGEVVQVVDAAALQKAVEAR